jgi:transcriptional regulator with XRE-family HTH domain
VLLGADVGELLKAARERAALSQRELARRARAGRGRVQSFERGATSPSTEVLDRLVAACGLQLRVHLERRVDPVEELAATVVAGEPDVPEEVLVALAERLDGAGVRWAVDGATALSVLGVAVPSDWPAVVVEDCPAFRALLTRFLVRGYDEEAGVPLYDGWSEPTTEEVGRYLGAGAFVLVAPLEMRVVATLPPVVRTVLDSDEGRVEVDVVVQAAVEAAHPRLAELMAAVRGYRGHHG